MPYNVLPTSDLDAAGILATGSWLPERVITNEELAASLGVTAAWIEDRTGVVERRVADAADATSDLATRAAERALAAAGVAPDELNMIVLATSTPDRPLPATACQVQANLGATRAHAFDVDAVCTGFVYGLDLAQKVMRGDPDVRHALVIGADIYSRILDYRDRRTCVLFGDGAGAVVLGRGPGTAQISYSSLGSDGTKTDYSARLPAYRHGRTVRMTRWTKPTRRPTSKPTPATGHPRRTGDAASRYGAADRCGHGPSWASA